MTLDPPFHARDTVMSRGEGTRCQGAGVVLCLRDHAFRTVEGTISSSFLGLSVRHARALRGRQSCWPVIGRPVPAVGGRLHFRASAPHSSYGHPGQLAPPALGGCPSPYDLLSLLPFKLFHQSSVRCLSWFPLGQKQHSSGRSCVLSVPSY